MPTQQQVKISPKKSMLKNVLNFAIFIHLHRYLRCCPECRLKRVEKSSKIISIPKLGYFFGFSIPRVAMFGSGLDRNGFVKNLLWDKHSPFVVEKMFPGQFEGNTSVLFDHSNRNLFFLSKLCSKIIFTHLNVCKVLQIYFKLILLHIQFY